MDHKWIVYCETVLLRTGLSQDLGLSVGADDRSSVSFRNMLFWQKWKCERRHVSYRGIGHTKYVVPYIGTYWILPCFVMLQIVHKTVTVRRCITSHNWIVSVRNKNFSIHVYEHLKNILFGMFMCAFKTKTSKNSSFLRRSLQDVANCTYYLCHFVCLRLSAYNNSRSGEHIFMKFSVCVCGYSAKICR